MSTSGGRPKRISVAACLFGTSAPKLLILCIFLVISAVAQAATANEAPKLQEICLDLDNPQSVVNFFPELDLRVYYGQYEEIIIHQNEIGNLFQYYKQDCGAYSGGFTRTCRMITELADIKIYSKHIYVRAGISGKEYLDERYFLAQGGETMIYKKRYDLDRQKSQYEILQLREGRSPRSVKECLKYVHKTP